MTATEALRPRRASQRGVVEARGFWLSDALLLPEVRRARVLSLWVPGAEVFEVPGGHVVLLPMSKRVAVDRCSGAPLSVQHGVLSTAPLTVKERLQLPPATRWVIVEASLARCVQQADLTTVDVSAWLDLSVFEVCATHSLGTSAQIAGVPDQLQQPPDIRALFDERIGRTAADYEQQRELVLALDAVNGPSPAMGHSLRSFLGTLRAAWSGALGWLAGVVGAWRLGTAQADHPRVTNARPSVGWLRRLRIGFARWLSTTRLMALLNRAQARYLQELLQLLAQHDDLAVLRRAIPLGDGSDPASRPALAPPAPRSNLKISLTRQSGGPSLGLHETLLAHLRQSYESVFERLDRAGKHAEAAFFLAEILNQPERAVAYLERHRQLRLAAELAEARKMPAGLVVRQWFLAGDQRRALAIAVREGAFEDAISRLERSGAREAADALRLLQAERLAAAGRLVAAARLAGRVQAGRALARRWLELARHAGDVLGLALELSLDAGRFADVQTALAPLLGEATSAAIQQRVLIGEELVRLDVSAGKSLARELTRQILADAGTLGDRELAKSASSIAHWVGGAFDADQPVVVSFPALRNARTLRRRYAAHECGTRRLYDLLACDTRFLVALGDGGVALIARDGRQVAHFDLPAEQLVVSQDGWRVLTVASRGQVFHVGRIDLATRRSEHWGEVRATSFARTFDGETWLVHDGAKPGASQLILLDALDVTPTAVRRISVPDGVGVDFIEISARHCNLIGSESFGPLERLRYELPSWTLRERKRVDLGERPADSVHIGQCAVTGNAPPVVCGRWVDIERTLEPLRPIRVRRGTQEVPITLDRGFGMLSLAVSSDEFCVTQRIAGGINVRAGSFPAARVLLELELEGAKHVAVRFTSGRLCLADDTGRLLDFDLTSISCLRDLRV